jgi:hypothetical protein
MILSERYIKFTEEKFVTKDDLKRIELQADVSFEHGQVIGNRVRRVAKKTIIFFVVVIGSIIASIFFFLYGFLDHKPKKLL